MNPKYSRYYTYIKPLLRNPQIRTYTTVIFNIIAITIFSVFAIRPTIKTIFSLQKDIKDQQQILDQLNTKAVNLTNGKKNLANINPDTIKKLNSLIPEKNNMSGLINSLSSLGLQYTASITGLQFQPTELVGEPTIPNPKATLQEIDFTVNTSSEYQNLTQLLNALGKTPRSMTIDNVSFSQSAGGPLIMSINGKAYFLKN